MVPNPTCIVAFRIPVNLLGAITSMHFADARPLLTGLVSFRAD